MFSKATRDRNNFSPIFLYAVRECEAWGLGGVLHDNLRQKPLLLLFYPESQETILDNQTTSSADFVRMLRSILSLLFLEVAYATRLWNEKASVDPYMLWATTAMKSLDEWYNNNTGLWESTGWWNAANILTTLADFNTFDSSLNATIRHVFNNTFTQAPFHNPTVVKIRTPYFVESYTTRSTTSESLGEVSALSKGFTNNFYDDEGWWALAWLKIYDITNEQRYLQSAIDLYEDMVGGIPATCGGIWWDKSHQHNTAIANELFLAVSARLAVQAPGNGTYQDRTMKQWDWFQNSGLLTENHTIRDGIDLKTCKAEEGVVWTYTHGVVLGALIDLDILSPNSTFLYHAWSIAHAAIGYFTDSSGILHEPCEPHCGADGSQFKGVFLRNLQRLQEVLPDPVFETFIDKNAHAIWRHDRDSSGKLGLVWSGPNTVTTASTHSSACDALVAAAGIE